MTDFCKKNPTFCMNQRQVISGGEARLRKLKLMRSVQKAVRFQVVTDIKFSKKTKRYEKFMSIKLLRRKRRSLRLISWMYHHMKSWRIHILYEKGDSYQYICNLYTVSDKYMLVIWSQSIACLYIQCVRVWLYWYGVNVWMTTNEIDIFTRLMDPGCLREGWNRITKMKNFAEMIDFILHE